MSTSDIAGAAYNAAIVSENGEVLEGRSQTTKLASSVAYLQQQLMLADETVTRLEGKVEKSEERLQDAKTALEDAMEERERLSDELMRVKLELRDMEEE